MKKFSIVTLIIVLVVSMTCAFASCKIINKINKTSEGVSSSESISGGESESVKDSESTSESDLETSESASESDLETSESESVTEPKELSDLVDFIVEVEGGRDIRVLQLSDVQTISEDQNRYAARGSGSKKTDTFEHYEKYIGQVIERYDPDFIIMTGDNTYGEFDDSGEQLVNLINFMDTFEIPWAPVFGNHDNESNMGVDWQCEQFENSPYCLFKQRTLTGNGNYSVGLTQDGELKRVFYMLDSNGCGYMSKKSRANGHSTSSVGFGNDQIEWYTQSMTEVSAYYPDAKLSMAFHIQLAVFAEAFAIYDYKASTIRDNPINLDKNPEAQARGDFGYIGREPKGPWDADKIVWNGIKNLGVDSIFVGHEHCNSASITYEGVRLTYGQKSSTYDRYNSEAVKDSGIYNSNRSGTPIIGGTYFNLSSEDGSITDSGLYLYDHELGYERPSDGEGEGEEDQEITMDNIPEGATVTTFDFNGVDLDANVTNSGIAPLKTSLISDKTSIPVGYDGEVYGLKTDNFACVGVKFHKSVNVNKLLGIFVRMYVSDYTVTSGKTPLIRIYDGANNTILSEEAFHSLGGENSKWVYINILDMVKSAKGIVDGANLNPFTLLYRFYGATQGTVYFDSLTLISNGDPYDFTADLEPEENIEIIRGEKCYKYFVKDFDGAEGVLNGGDYKYFDIDQKSYSLAFKMNATTFGSTIYIYGSTSESAPTKGIRVKINKSSIRINNCNSSYTFQTGKEYEIEVGFVNLYDGNTSYVFVRVNGNLVAWELVETYGYECGNLAINSINASDSFYIS